MCCMASTSGTTLCCLISMCSMGCLRSSFLVAIAIRISIRSAPPAPIVHEFSIASHRSWCKSGCIENAVILLPMPRFIIPRPSIWVLSLLCALPAMPSFAWGPDGHRIVNRLAAEKLPPEIPAFLRTESAVTEIEYLGPEPDRWRSPNEQELNAAQAPEHYIDLELADMVGTLPRRRYDFIAALYATALTHPDKAEDLRPEKVGLQPWVTNEVYQRLQAALREYREQTGRHEDTKPVEAAAIFYAGWLGHYVGDGSMPLHTTVHYNGWVEKENPNQYVTSPGIHSQWESGYVHRNMKGADAEPL